jgi:hypothetical protein
MTPLLLAAMAGAPAIARTDWERFVQPETPTVETVEAWLGHPLDLDSDGPEGRHYFVGDRPPYKGGVDVYAAPTGELQEVIFYLDASPLYLASQIERAAKLKTPWTLDDVRSWYGKPDEVTTSRRNGTTTWTYWRGARKVPSLMFTSLPHSPYLFRVVAERASD